MRAASFYLVGGGDAHPRLDYSVFVFPISRVNLCHLALRQLVCAIVHWCRCQSTVTFEQE